MMIFFIVHKMHNKIQDILLVIRYFYFLLIYSNSIFLHFKAYFQGKDQKIENF